MDWRPASAFMMKRTDIWLSLFSGAMLALAFPSANVSLFAWVALVPLLTGLRGKGTGGAFKLGFISGAV